MIKNEEIVNIFWYHVCLAMNHRSAFSSPSSQETESMRAKESIKKNTEMNRKQQLSFHLFVLNIHKNFFILKENSCISKSTYMTQNLITIIILNNFRDLVVRNAIEEVCYTWGIQKLGLSPTTILKRQTFPACPAHIDHWRSLGLPRVWLSLIENSLSFSWSY